MLTLINTHTYVFTTSQSNSNDGTIEEVCLRCCYLRRTLAIRSGIVNVRKEKSDFSQIN